MVEELLKQVEIIETDKKTTIKNASKIDKNKIM